MIHSKMVPTAAAFVEKMHPGHAFSLGFFHEILIGIAGRRWIDPLQPARGLFQMLAMQHQELQRLRQRENHDGGDHKRSRRSEIEDRAPTEAGNQPGRDEAAKGSAGRESVAHDHHDGDAQLARAIFADQSDRVRHDGAQRRTREKADHQHLLHVRRLGGQKRQHRKAQRYGNQHGPASDFVRQHAEQQRTNQNAEQPGAENRPELRIGDVPFLQDGGRDVAHGLHVEAVHDQAEAAEDAQAQLKAAEAAVADDFRNVDPLGRFHLHREIQYIEFDPQSLHFSVAT